MFQNPGLEDYTTASSESSTDWVEVIDAQGNAKMVPERKGLFFPTRGESYTDAFNGKVPKEKVTPKRVLNHHCPFEGCTKAYSRPSLLKQHLRSHNNERCFVCTYEDCGKGFFRRSHLQAHLQSHSVDKRYHCSFCAKGFNTRQHLQRHEMTHKSINRCPHENCAKECRTDLQLLQHCVEDHSTWKHQCTYPGCGRAVGSERQLLYHWERDHGQQPAFHCPHDSCNEVAPLWIRLQKHVAKKHNQWLCHHCDSMFGNMEGMHEHEKTVHGLSALYRGGVRTPGYPRELWTCPEESCTHVYFDREKFAEHYASHKKGSIDNCQVIMEYEITPHIIPYFERPPKRRRGKLEETQETQETTFTPTVEPSLKRQRKTRSVTIADTAHITNTNASIMDKITGAGYSSTRTLACVVDSCPHRFYRKYDLDRHVLSMHTVYCMTCQYGTHLLTDLRDHMHDHHHTQWPPECYLSAPETAILAHLAYLREHDTIYSPSYISRRSNIPSPIPIRAHSESPMPMYPTQTPTPGPMGDSPAPLQQLNESLDYAPFDTLPLSAMSPSYLSPALSHSILTAEDYSVHEKKEAIDPELFQQRP